MIELFTASILFWRFFIYILNAFVHSACAVALNWRLTGGHSCSEANNNGECCSRLCLSTLKTWLDFHLDRFNTVNLDIIFQQNIAFSIRWQVSICNQPCQKCCAGVRGLSDMKGPNYRICMQRPPSWELLLKYLSSWGLLCRITVMFWGV